MTKTKTKTVSAGLVERHMDKFNALQQVWDRTGMRAVEGYFQASAALSSIDVMRVAVCIRGLVERDRTGRYDI